MKEKMKDNFGLIFIIFVIVLVLSVPFATLYIMSEGHIYSMYIVRKEASEHLKNIGYTNEDIIEARYVVSDSMSNNEYYAGCYSVIFKNEPEITYYYGVAKENKQVCQFAEKDEKLNDGSYISNFGKCLHSETPHH